MLDPLIVTLSIEDNKLVARSEEATLGSQYDHNARAIEVMRPEQFAEDDLILIFQNAITRFDDVHLGTGNTYLVPRLLTRTLRLELSAAIQRDGQEIAHSGILKLSLRAEIPPKLPPPDEVLDLYNVVHTELMHSVAREGNEVRLLSLLGETLGTINVAGGGGGGSGNTIKIGTVTTETLDPDEGARVDASMRYEADADYLDMVFHIPRGRDGVSIQGLPGEDGYTPVKGVDYDDGQDGLPGADGKAATIRIGDVTDGDEVSVTNVGTDTDVVLNFVLRRGAPGSGGGDDLPWVSGHFADRSLAKDAHNVMTPVYVIGDASMIDGQKLIAPIKGLYLAVFGSGGGSAPGAQRTTVYKNIEIPAGDDSIGCIIVTSTGILPPLTLSLPLDQGDYLKYVQNPGTAQSTTTNGSPPISFLIMCVRRLDDD